LEHPGCAENLAVTVGGCAVNANRSGPQGHLDGQKRAAMEAFLPNRENNTPETGLAGWRLPSMWRHDERPPGPPARGLDRRRTKDV